VEEVHEGAGEQQQVRQDAEDVSGVLGHEEEADDRQEREKDDS
jgi:hypothetical protein